MSTYTFGEVVLVAFPFTNQTATKQRPAAVISSTAYQRERPDLNILAISSQVRATLAFGEAVIHDWQAAGLIKPSALKPLSRRASCARLSARSRAMINSA
jgi:mRNA interferase MazF